MKTKIIFQWIKVHQDENESKEKIHGPFPRHVQLNIEIDTWAKKAARIARCTKITCPIYNTTKMGFYNDKDKLIGDLMTQLYHNLYYNKLWDYVKRKHNWKEVYMKQITWKHLQQVLNTYQPYYQTHIMQMMHDWHNIGSRKALISKSDRMSPTHSGLIEDKMHFLWCQDIDFKIRRSKHYNLLKKQLQALDTYPGIITAISKLTTIDWNGEWVQLLK